MAQHVRTEGCRSRAIHQPIMACCKDNDPNVALWSTKYKKMDFLNSRSESESACSKAL